MPDWLIDIAARLPVYLTTCLTAGLTPCAPPCTYKHTNLSANTIHAQLLAPVLGRRYDTCNVAGYTQSVCVYDTYML